MPTDHPDPADPTAPAPPTGPVPAVIQGAYGGPEVFDRGEVELDPLKPTDVLVQVHAAAIDRGTWHLMTGEPTMVRLALGRRAPRIRVPGRDLAGVVAAVGSEVRRFAPGDRVHGTANGSLAAFTVTSESRLAPMPDRLTFAQAAALPISGLTAYQAVVDAGRVGAGRVGAGQRVLVTGASGGVGTYAVQIAAAHGAEVTASCRSGAHDAVAALGAARVIDRHAVDPYAEGTTYDLIIDIAGQPSIRSLRAALAHRGMAVIVGGEGGSRFAGGLSRQLRAVMLSPFVPQRFAWFVNRERGAELERLDELVARDAVTPLIDSVFALDDIRAAMERLDSGEAVGKVAISLVD